MLDSNVRTIAVDQKIPSDILSFLRVLRENNVEVTGPTQGGDVLVFYVNDHALTEQEIRHLGQSDRLTSWDIYEYIKTRRHRF